MSERMWPEGTEFLTGADTEHSWVRLDQAIAVVAELEAENANFESGARCDRDEIEGLKAERDALRHARLPCREAEVAQRRYEQAEAELAAVGSDLQDEAEYNITLRERAEQAEAERDSWKRTALDRQEELHRIRMCYPGGEGEELLSQAEAELDAMRARYTHRWTQAVEGVETEFEVELVPKPELDQAEAELTRARAVVVLLKLAASNVLSRGRRFPPRVEWRELHTVVRGAGAWLAERNTP